ncbi:hypothetical protein [Spongiactinospora gelatinilytica]|nr:hypothetical protein [Spongiactinospora gelatinilytica]
MNELILYTDGAFRWSWGPGIGPVADVSQTAERIMHVLRTVKA